MSSTGVVKTKLAGSSTSGFLIPSKIGLFKHSEMDPRLLGLKARSYFMIVANSGLTFLNFFSKVELDASSFTLSMYFLLVPLRKVRFDFF